MSLLARLGSSLTTRLLVVYVVTAAVVLAIILVTLIHGFARQWQFNARPHLEQYLDFISEEIGDPPSEEKARQLAERLPVDIHIIGPEGSYSTNGEALAIDDVSFEDDSHRRSEAYPRLGNSRIQFSSTEDRTLLKSTVGDYQVFYELQHRHRHRHRQSTVLPAVLGVLIALTLCFLVIRRLLRPVRDIRDGVRRMGQGELDYQIPVRGRNDLAELAGSINTMASDIEQMLDAKRQLLLGASHELRSPLTRAKVATQLLDESRQRDLLEEDLAEMEDLISSILESERMKSGHTQLERTHIDVERLLLSVVDDMHADGIAVECADDLPVLHADELRLRLVLRNLIGNALKHHPSPVPNQAAVSVRADSDDAYLRIVVADSGPGIAPEHIEHVTKPFYRTDASRSRATGGVGLGLYLSMLITEAHGGTLEIESRTASSAAEGEVTGTVITVRLPWA